VHIQPVITLTQCCFDFKEINLFLQRPTGIHRGSVTSTAFIAVDLFACFCFYPWEIIP
jgi:hypothetical protein